MAPPRAARYNPAVRRIHLTLAISEYDHVRDLTTGVVEAEGVELTHLPLPIEEIFYRFTRFREWEVSELSMGKYVSLVSQDDASLTAIPVFPSRVFRHSAIYVRANGPVRHPRDLAGRRVGIPEWAQTAGIYARGALVHQYGVRLEDVEWQQAGVDEPGREEKVALKLPPGVRITPRADRTLDGLLLAGEVDALITARPPESVRQRRPEVARLFPDAMAVERAYWRETGIFPIMHVVAIRRDVLERHPWVAMSLYKAFSEARRRSVARAREVSASRFPLPWVPEQVAQACELFGDDFWPYGIEANRRTLDAFLGFALEQGVCHRVVTVEELFPPEVRSTFKR
jgi:4,5-dihydroxyphthalate decarboxylase